jgi:hypothetical protein
MKEKTQSKLLARRNFLKVAGVSIGAAGIAAAALTGVPTKSVAETKRKGAGYRETEHVRKYYELARF